MRWRCRFDRASVLRFALSCAVGLPSSAFAQQWINPGDGDWQLGANWDSGTPPSGSANPGIDNGGTAVIRGSAATAGGIAVGVNAGNSSALSIRDSGTLTLSGVFTSIVGDNPNAIGTVTVVGAGSQWIAPSGDLTVGASGQGTVTISDGGLMHVLNLDVAPGAGSQGTINVTSNGSFIVGSSALLGRGSGVATLNISGGGTATFGFHLALGYDLDSAATVNVTGPGSSLSVGSFFNIGQGFSSTGTLNLSDGGAAIADGGAGTIVLGSGPSASGILNIGAAPGSAATAPGSVSAAAVDLSATSAINFNHAASVYTFASQITGSGTVNTYGGTPILSGANSYSGGTFLNGGVLSVASDGNLGAASGGLVFDGGALATTANFSSARALTFDPGGGAIATSSGTTLSLSGALGGAGGLIKEGSGTLTFWGAAPIAGPRSCRPGRSRAA
jgi:fibronectin-binding autotransporter adhesin